MRLQVQCVKMRSTAHIPSMSTNSCPMCAQCEAVPVEVVGRMPIAGCDSTEGTGCPRARSLSLQDPAVTPA